MDAANPFGPEPITAAVAILAPIFSGIHQTSFGQSEGLAQALLDRDEMRNNVWILLLIEGNLGIEAIHLLIKVLNNQIDELLRLCTHWIPLQIGLR
jgi:hypothetical protein